MRLHLVFLAMLLGVAVAQFRTPAYVERLNVHKPVDQNKPFLVPDAQPRAGDDDMMLSQSERDREEEKETDALDAEADNEGQDARLLAEQPASDDAGSMRFRQVPTGDEVAHEKPVTPDEMKEFRFAKAHMRQKGIFGAIGKGLKAGWNFLKKKVLGKKSKRTATDVEDCVCCRWVWLQVEAQVGNSQVQDNLYDTFTQVCINAQKAAIFYPGCEDMFDDIYGMIGDYMDGYTVNQLCEGAKMCR